MWGDVGVGYPLHRPRGRVLTRSPDHVRSKMSGSCECDWINITTRENHGSQPRVVTGAGAGQKFPTHKMPVPAGPAMGDFFLRH